ncbi:MAG: hypothetical protein AB7G06_08880 [Bdellovibrionales bacterium]
MPSTADFQASSDQKPRFFKRYRAAAWLLVISLSAIVGIGIIAYQTETRLVATEERLHVMDEKPLPLQAARKLEDALGYDGFLGSLSTFHSQPSLQNLQRLRADMEDAEQALITIAASAPLKADLRIKSLQGGVKFFKQALSNAELVLTGGAIANHAVVAELDDVYANILAATARLERTYQGQHLAALRQQGQTQGTLLWLSLFLCLGLIIGVWLVARHSYADPIRRLLMSLRAKEALDSNIPIWGVNRADAVGDLARALEMLRQRLLHAPDIIVTRGDEKLPIRFTGAGGAIFQALVDEMANAVSNIRSAELPGTLSAIEQMNKSLASNVALMYADLKASTDSIIAVSNALASGEEKTSHAAQQLAERAQMMGEIAQLIGTQAQTSLRDLLGASGQIKSTAAAGDAVIRGFATKANDLSERLVASTNLMRAGGKVLQETVESVRGRVLEAAAALTQNDARLSTWLAQSENRLAGLAAKAEEAFEQGRAGHEAIAELAAAGARVSATANRLELSQTDLTRAVTAMLSQSEQFAPLSLQLRDLHEQLTTHMTKHVAVGEDMMLRLATQTERLSQINDELQSGSMAATQQRLGKLSELTDSLAGVLGQIHDLPSKLKPLGQLHDDVMLKLGGALDKNTAATEMNALRMDANLRLVSDQLTELLQKLNNEQSSLLEQVQSLRDVLTGVPLSSVTPQHITEVESALGDRVEKQYQQFTTELKGLLHQFEQAIAKPVVEQAGQPESAPASVEEVILQRLRETTPNLPNEEQSLLDPAADLDSTIALTRLSQIKKLTGALNRQARLLGTLPSDTQPSEPEALANQAKELISAVMDAISDLTQLASDISDLSQRSKKD